MLSGWLSYVALSFTTFRVYGFFNATFLIPLVVMGKLVNSSGNGNYTYLSSDTFQLVAITVLAMWYAGSMSSTSNFVSEDDHAAVGSVLILLSKLCYAFALQWQKRMFIKYDGSSSGLWRLTVWHMMLGVSTIYLVLHLGMLVLAGQVGSFVRFMGDPDVAVFAWPMAIGTATQRLSTLIVIQMFGPVTFTVTNFLFSYGRNNMRRINLPLNPVWVAMWIAVWLWIAVSEFFRYRRMQKEEEERSQQAAAGHNTMHSAIPLDAPFEENCPETELTSYKDEEEEEYDDAGSEE
ncbi:MAG: hypothetical protein SGARI_005406 [Bacillariaceae sp.]